VCRVRSAQPSCYHSMGPQLLPHLWPSPVRQEADFFVWKISFCLQLLLDWIAVQCVFSKHMSSCLTGTCVYQYACDKDNNTRIHTSAQLQSQGEQYGKKCETPTSVRFDSICKYKNIGKWKKEQQVLSHLFNYWYHLRSIFIMIYYFWKPETEYMFLFLCLKRGYVHCLHIY
jgi:hypothetical protein